MTSLWTEKHSPKSLDELIGNSSAIDRIREWAESWNNGKKQKPLFFHGITGVGKTVAVQALVNDFDFELLELNASDDRDAKKIEKIAGLSSVSATFSGKKRLILFDEIDGLYKVDRGGAGAVVKILKENPCPIILTANNLWDQKLSSIRTYAEKVDFKKVHYATVAKHLQKIAGEEGKEINYEIAKKISLNAGDVRSAINDLQLLTLIDFEEKDLELLTNRDREATIYSVVQTILKTNDFEKSRRSIIEVNEQPDFILKWIEENVPTEYKKEQDLFNAFENISKADIFLGRVYKRWDYGMWRYASVLMSSGVSLSKQETYRDWNKYAFPSLIKSLSKTKGSRAVMKSIGLKIGEQCHVSSKTAMLDYIPMFETLMQDRETAARLTAQFDFDEKEIEFFSVKAPKKLIKEAEELKAEYISTKMNSNKGLSQFL